MSGTLFIVGLGPAGLSVVDSQAAALLGDETIPVYVRTLHHPAARELAAERTVVTCDDLYDSEPDFDSVYRAISGRVLDAARSGQVVFAVPGSALVGERSVAMIREHAAAEGIDVRVLPGESFLDSVYERVGLDPIAAGVQILDGRSLPDPLPLHLPTIVTQVDRDVVMADVASTLAKVLPDDVAITVLEDLGSPEEVVHSVPLGDLARVAAGPRTSLFLEPPPAGWHGLITTNRRLRAECPWDREQTHHSLVSHLVEEAYETVESLSRLAPAAPAGAPDFGAYAEVEEELGDLLLQVVFHATLAAEAGAFDIEEVAEGIRRKLVSRHPHVFGDVGASNAEQVLTNWEHLKAEEKDRDSLMDDVPSALPAIARADKLQRRAASVGFDWDGVDPVIAKVYEELAELHEALDDPDRATAELGDLMFAAVNLARHLGIDAELALRHAADGFATRFRGVERLARDGGRSLTDLSLEEMDALWDDVKGAESAGAG